MDSAGKVIVDENNSHNKMSYCSTCKILRPPRSFHCGTCGVCIEVHDHHCPWVGTCIGLRNAKHFICFLICTSLHAMFTAGICLLSFIMSPDDRNEDTYYYTDMATKSDCVYGSIISISLMIFALFQILYLSVRNIASNEDIRYRWNGASDNANAVALYAKKSSWLAKTRYFLCSKTPPSKI